MGKDIWRYLLGEYHDRSWRQPSDCPQLKLGSHVMVVLSSAEAVRDVLERQSAATVSRNSNYFDQLAHDGKFLAMAPYCKCLSRTHHQLESI
jgi:hypothetical protein